MQFLLLIMLIQVFILPSFIYIHVGSFQYYWFFHIFSGFDSSNSGGFVFNLIIMPFTFSMIFSIFKSTARLKLKILPITTFSIPSFLCSMYGIFTTIATVFVGMATKDSYPAWIFFPNTWAFLVIGLIILFISMHYRIGSWIIPPLKDDSFRYVDDYHLQPFYFVSCLLAVNVNGKVTMEALEHETKLPGKIVRHKLHHMIASHQIKGRFENRDTFYLEKINYPCFPKTASSKVEKNIEQSQISQSRSQVASSRMEDQERLKKLQQIIKVSDSLDIARLADVLKIDEKLLWDKIFDWAEQFGFRIKESKVIFGQGDTSAFINTLDKEFARWDETSNSKEGKI